MNRRLYRCRYDRRLGGVAGGLAEYFELDPTLVRILWFVSIFFGGLSIIVYLGLWLIVPLEPIDASAAAVAGATPASPVSAVHSWSVPAEMHRHEARGAGRFSLFLGWALVLFGALALADVLLPSMLSWRHLWPLFFVGLGAFLIIATIRRDQAAPRPPATTEMEDSTPA